MAILTGVLNRLNGSVGNLTFVQTNGRTLVREKVAPKSKRTWRVMRRRVTWANLVNLYRAFSGTLHPSFENKARRVSDFNEFMSANMGSNGVALTSGLARQGGCVVAAYQVTRGSLPSVEVDFGNANIPESDIALGALTLGNSTTLKAFSDAVVQNNAGWQSGDQLSVFVAHQMIDTGTGVPHVSIDAIEVTLDAAASTTLLKDVMDISLFSVVDGMLGLSGPVNGGVAFVHSRKTPSGTKVSTQFFVVNNSYLAQYQTSEAFVAAVNSYGGLTQDEFITPNVDDIVAPNV